MVSQMAATLGLNKAGLQCDDFLARGDRDSLEDRVAKAVTSPITSGQPHEKAVIDRLSRIAGYAPLFKAAFPNEPRPDNGTEYRQGDQRL
jgi:hypothetical protein